MKIDRRLKNFILFELQMYHHNKTQLEQYKADIIHGKDYTVDTQPRGSATSDQTLNKVERLCSSVYIQRTERELSVIESVLDSLDSSRYKALDMLYWRNTHTAEGVGMELHVGKSTVYNWVDSIVYLIAKELGYME